MQGTWTDLVSLWASAVMASLSSGLAVEGDESSRMDVPRLFESQLLGAKCPVHPSSGPSSSQQCAAMQPGQLAGFGREILE